MVGATTVTSKTIQPRRDGCESDRNQCRVCNEKCRRGSPQHSTGPGRDSSVTPPLHASELQTSGLLMATPRNAHRSLCNDAGEVVTGTLPAVVATASSFPPVLYTQEEIMEAFLKQHPHLSNDDIDFVQRVFRGTMYRTGPMYVNREDMFRKMSRVEYLDHVKPKLLDLSVRASKDAIDKWGGDLGSITHMIWGTMTGSIQAPTVDVQVARQLGLSPAVKRLNVENMGCITGFRCLGLARDIAAADPRHVVLVVTADVRSALGNQMSTHVPGTKVDRLHVIVSALFRDGAGAAIVTGTNMASAPLWEIISHESKMLPEESLNMVTMKERNDGIIKVSIDRRLPESIGAELPSFVASLLEPHRIPIGSCCFAVHTGGPKVLRIVAESLGINPIRMGMSWTVLKRYGNLSGSSNLVVLDHVTRFLQQPDLFLSDADIEDNERFQLAEYCVCLSFGPGVSIEGILLKNACWGSYSPDSNNARS
ncbi:Chalcone/stilbene synthase N-terminal domain-containing protein [Plasmodiophora brassicae]